MSQRGPRIIVTGGIGSGKSTVTRMLEEKGIGVVDADRLGHEILTELAVIEAIRERWPAVVSERGVDRAVLAKTVFEQPDELRRLERLIHPYIVRRIRELDRRFGSRPLVVEVSVPTLDLPSGWTRVVVDAPEDVRRQRLLERGLEASDIDRRMAVQPRRERWLESADLVIDNVGDLHDLAEQVEEITGDLVDHLHLGLDRADKSDGC